MVDTNTIIIISMTLATVTIVIERGYALLSRIRHSDCWGTHIEVDVPLQGSLPSSPHDTIIPIPPPHDNEHK